jgi:hypothetical protein
MGKFTRAADPAAEHAISIGKASSQTVMIKSSFGASFAVNSSQLLERRVLRVIFELCE